MAEGVMARLDSRDAAHAWLLLQRPRGLVADSRRVRAGDAFIAWPGQATDARRHVASALAAGASACLVEAEGVEGFALEGERRVAALRGLKAAAGEIASRFFGTPSARLAVVAVTGTNGKTSTTWWIAQALAALGRRGAVIGTLGIGEPVAGSAGRLASTGLTTPDPVTLQAALADFADRGVAVCAIEASSIGIAEHRLVGTRVAVAVFTNFTQDHLDYHGDMAAYWQAKAQLFAWPGLSAAIVNIDDAQGVELAASLAAQAWTVSTQREARIFATDIRHGAAGLAFDLHEGGRRVPVSTPLIGDYNVANLLSVIGVLRALGIGLDDAARACAALAPVPGRMERIGAAGGPGPEVVVDYAHTPDALEKTLAALRPLAAGRDGQLWCVFGCGGDRDAAKRPLMGAIACRLADRVVVTSDNPRLESAELIISQILAGAIGHDEIDVIENRAEAIGHAIGSAAPNDVVLIAGKGHEEYQDVAGTKLPFSDHEQARAALRARPAAPTVPAVSSALAPEPVPEATAAGSAAAVPAALPARTDRAGMLTLGDAAGLIPGARLVGDPQTAFARVHSDTRTLRPGDLFVALRGERFDAHDFLDRAKGAGAACALAERGLAEAGLAGIEAADSLAALGALGAAWRRRFALPMVAVTGSNGKTTVTQMIASILRAWLGDAAFATVGNFNNEIGLPLTLLRLREGHRAGVVELGMNHAGEIARLAAMAAPTVALVNNAQREHLEFMRDVDAVARENGSVIAALPAGGTAVFPADDAHAATWRALAANRPVLTFAEAGAADVTAQVQWHADHWQIALATPAGAIHLALRVAGRHNVRNALAAATAAFAAGCPLAAIGSGLERFEAVPGRSQLRSLLRDGVTRTVVDDSYNANPDSVRAAIEVLAGLPAPRWLILGDMGEIGDQGPALHREAGAYAHAKGIDSLWAVGAESASTALPFPGARAFADVESLIAALAEAPAFAAVLVKGSRFMAMERVVGALAGEAAGDAHAA